MSTNPGGIIDPPIDDPLEKVDSKYRLVIFATKRVRQTNAYYSQPGEEFLENVGPLVSVAFQEKPLSITLHELQGDLLQYTQTNPEVEAAERAAAEADPALTLVDSFAELDTNSPS